MQRGSEAPIVQPHDFVVLVPADGCRIANRNDPGETDAPASRGAEHRAGRLDTARDLLEESTRLRRELGFRPGVAANLVGLAHIALTEGRRDDALALVEEAASIAHDSGSHGILRHVEEARAALHR